MQSRQVGTIMTIKLASFERRGRDKRLWQCVRKRWCIISDNSPPWWQTLEIRRRKATLEWSINFLVDYKRASLSEGGGVTPMKAWRTALLKNAAVPLRRGDIPLGVSSFSGSSGRSYMAAASIHRHSVSVRKLPAEPKTVNHCVWTTRANKDNLSALGGAPLSDHPPVCLCLCSDVL